MERCNMATIVNLTHDAVVSFHQTNLCAQVDELSNEYVFFTGGIAGISDSSSEGNPKTLNGRSDIVELDRN